MSIKGNEKNNSPYSVGLSIGEGAAAYAFIGWKFVEPLKNPPEYIKKSIRYLITHKDKIKMNYDIYITIREISDYSKSNNRYNKYKVEKIGVLK